MAFGNPPSLGWGDPTPMGAQKLEFQGLGGGADGGEAGQGCLKKFGFPGERGNK